MFSRPAVSISVTARASPAHFLSGVVATLGLLLVIFALARSGRSRTTPAAAGAYIGAAYFFTSSASFANPAITVGRHAFRDERGWLASGRARTPPSVSRWSGDVQLVQQFLGVGDPAGEHLRIPAAQQ